jgi:hypothetical protein
MFVCVVNIPIFCIFEPPEEQKDDKATHRTVFSTPHRQPEG